MGAIVKTLILVLGEYELDDFYQSEFPDNYSKIFTIMLLVLLAVVGSLVMVNLFVAIIGSDIEDLKKSGQIQEVVIKAHHIVHYETILKLLGLNCASAGGGGRLKKLSMSSSIGPTMTSSLGDGNKVKVCPHSICKCNGRSLDESISKKLKHIIRKRNLLREMHSS